MLEFFIFAKLILKNCSADFCMIAPTFSAYKSLAERHSSSDSLSGLSEVLWSYKQRIRCCKLCLHIEAQEG